MVAALTPTELRALLGAARRPFDRTLLSVLHGCGLRASEGRHLQVGDIDAAAGLLHIRHGKGDKARTVRLSDAVLGRLQDHWRHYRPLGPWLFPPPATMPPRRTTSPPGRIARSARTPSSAASA